MGLKGTPSTTIDFNGTLLMDDMCRLFDCHHGTIRKRLHEGSFPIRPLPDIDNKYRWSGPFVRRWLEENGLLQEQD